MDCTQDRDLLEAYLDGELSFERSLEVEAHLGSCPGCSSKLQSWKEIRETVRGSELYYRAPALVRDDIRKRIPRDRRTRGVPWFQRWLWAGAGAAFATAGWIVVVTLIHPAIRSSDQEIVANHVRSLMENHLMDVVSTDQHTVKPWFDGKLDFAPPVQDFSAEGYPLAGGRLDYLERRNVAVLIYHRALHVINLYVWPAEDNSNTAVHVQTIQGYNVLSWRENGFEFRAVSDLNAAELRGFARLLARNQ